MTVNSVPASTSLLEEFNALAPARDKSSDGTIGDSAHADSASDHNPDETGNTGGMEDADHTNEVHARDVDSSGPWPAGWSMERCVQIILDRSRSGWENRLRYVIYNRRIWSASSGWAQRAYTLPNPHIKHAHFSFRYGSGSGAGNPENITSPWGFLAVYLREQDMAIDNADVNKILDGLEARLVAKDDSGMDLGLRNIFRALPWQYTGGGLQGATSTLEALSDSQPTQKAIADLTTLVLAGTEATAQEIAEALAPLIVIPDDSDLTPEQVTEAVLDAFRQGTGTQ